MKEKHRKSLLDLVRVLKDGYTDLEESYRRVLMAPGRADMQKRMREFFLFQRDLFLKEFEKYQEQFVEAEIKKAAEDIMAKVEGKTKAMLTEIITLGTSKALNLSINNMAKKFAVGISFDLQNPRAVKFLADNAAEKVTKINETTREYIRTVITEGVEQGNSYAKTAKAIKDRFVDFAIGDPRQNIRSRAELVAITETANAYGQGNYMFVQEMKDAGLEMEKSWLTSGGERVCEDCQGNEDDGWIPVDNTFQDGSDCEPAHPACECTVLYQAKGE